MGCLLAVASLGLFLAHEQSELAKTSALNESTLLTNGLSSAIASDMILKDYAQVEQTVLQFTLYTKLINIQIINPRGFVVVEAHYDAQSNTWHVLHGQHIANLPQDQRLATTLSNNRIISWAPILAGNLIGWVQTEVSLDKITETQYKIYRDTALASVLSVLLLTLLIMLLLRRPIQQLKRAAQFSMELYKNQGAQLLQPSSYPELEHLVHALNDASSKLHSQDEEVKILSTLIEYSDDPVYILDVADDFRMTFVNDAACRHYGMTREQLLTLRVPDWDPEIDQAKMQQFWQTLRAQKHLSFISKHKLANGKIVPVEISANYITHAGRELIAGYFKDIQERVQVEQELRAAKDLAERAATARSIFLANMSHEIRTPMNGIIGLARLVLNSALSTETRDYVSKIFISAQSLLGILNDILDFSKLDAGRIVLELHSFKLEEVIQNLNGMFEDVAHSKNLEFKLDIDPALPPNYVGDALRIQQILANLIGNAIKFTEQGYIVLRVQLKQLQGTQALLCFEVEDSGIGIKSTDLHKLFQPFSQADGSITRKFGGTGLGLIISQSLLALMGGQFEIDTQEGQGTRIRFDLHLALAPMEANNPVSVRKQTSEGQLQHKLSTMAACLQGATILLVEDNRINQLVITQFLKLSGMEVIVAENGVEALEKLQQHRFSAVLMDVQMPVMDGMEATIHLRQMPEFASLPVCQSSPCRLG